jgi:hypothetical protein
MVKVRVGWKFGSEPGGFIVECGEMMRGEHARTMNVPFMHCEVGTPSDDQKLV